VPHDVAHSLPQLGPARDTFSSRLRIAVRNAPEATKLTASTTTA
jgi:hypothetical protein